MAKKWIYLFEDDAVASADANPPAKKAAERNKEYKDPKMGVKSMDSKAIEQKRKEEQGYAMRDTKEAATGAKNVAYLAKEQMVRKRQEAQKEKEANAAAKSSDASDTSDSVDETVEETVKEEVKIVRANEVYSLLTVRGMKGKLSATLENLNDGGTVVVKVGDKLPTGHIVQEITKDTIMFKADDREDVLLFNSQSSSEAPSGLSLAE